MIVQCPVPDDDAPPPIPASMKRFYQDGYPKAMLDEEGHMIGVRWAEDPAEHQRIADKIKRQTEVVAENGYPAGSFNVPDFFVVSQPARAEEEHCPYCKRLESRCGCGYC